MTGPNSPLSTSGVILLDDPRPYSDAVTACRALGEEVWSPERNASSIRPNLDYLRYQGKVNSASTLWIASRGNSTRALSVSGSISRADPASRLPVLCTQTAPYSSDKVQDTSRRWRVAVEANNQTVNGWVCIRTLPSTNENTRGDTYP